MFKKVAGLPQLLLPEREPVNDLIQLTSYSTSLRDISSGRDLGLNGFEVVGGTEDVQRICDGFRVVGESRGEEDEEEDKK